MYKYIFWGTLFFLMGYCTSAEVAENGERLSEEQKAKEIQCVQEASNYFYPIADPNEVLTFKEKQDALTIYLLQCAFVRLSETKWKGNMQAFAIIKWDARVFRLLDKKDACVIFIREWNRQIKLCHSE